MSNEEILEKVASEDMRTWNLKGFKKNYSSLYKVILLAMDRARIDEHSVIKESVNPEEPKNGFNDDLLKKEIIKYYNNTKHKPIGIRINPDDWFEFIELHRLMNGESMHPSSEGDWYWGGLKIDLRRDVESGRWFLI